MIIYANFDYIFSYPEPLSSDEELMIKQIYLDSLPKNEFYSYTIDDIDFTYYFGNYDGAYVVNINNQRAGVVWRMFMSIMSILHFNVLGIQLWL